MKRTLYDSEYDRVRRKAGFDKPRYEFPDEQEERESEARVEEMSADFRRRMAAVAAEEARVTGERLAAQNKRTSEYSAIVIRREYAALGLTPPEPLVSLALLRRLGWTLEEFVIGGETRWALTKPVTAAPTRRQSEC